MFIKDRNLIPFFLFSERISKVKAADWANALNSSLLNFAAVTHRSP